MIFSSDWNTLTFDLDADERVQLCLSGFGRHLEVRPLQIEIVRTLCSTDINFTVSDITKDQICRAVLLQEGERRHRLEKLFYFVYDEDFESDISSSL